MIIHGLPATLLPHVALASVASPPPAIPDGPLDDEPGLAPQLGHYPVWLLALPVAVWPLVMNTADKGFTTLWTRGAPHACP